MWGERGRCEGEEIWRALDKVMYKGLKEKPTEKQASLCLMCYNFVLGFPFLSVFYFLLGKPSFPLDGFLFAGINPVVAFLRKDAFKTKSALFVTLIKHLHVSNYM